MIKKDLYDARSSLYVLGGLLKNPSIFDDDRYCFLQTDFQPRIQELIFSAIYNLYKQGASQITSTDVERYLSTFSIQYEYYKQNDGVGTFFECEKNAEDYDEAQFDFYYQRIKKFAILRDLDSVGIDTSRIYNTNDILNRNAEDEKLNKMSVDDIVKVWKDTLENISGKHAGRDSLKDSINASKGLYDLIQGFIEVPDVGLPLEGDLVNSVSRGARLGKLYTYSSSTGGGKTRYMVGNACALSLPYIDYQGNVVTRNDFQKVVFVSTEMEASDIQTLIVAHVSGVNEEHIIYGKYDTEDERKRVAMAIDLIEKYKDNFIIDCLTNPSIGVLRSRLIMHILKNHVSYIFFDYIFTSPGLITEFAAADVKEYVALMMLSNTLKELAMIYDVFIQTGTQLNENWAKETVRDQNCLRGSKAIADKIDLGLIGVRIPDIEWERVQDLWKAMVAEGKIPNLKPNIVIDVYKNRRGSLNHVKIFRHFDFGTCRATDLFMTEAGGDFGLVTNITYITVDNTKMTPQEMEQRGDIKWISKICVNN